MEKDINNIAAQSTSFWGLITNSLIQVPNYQREYAQGRNNRRAELIRNGFVTSLYGSIKNNEPLELDFIFGGKESDDKDNNSFNPVDGQQRLTILFLLHWYVFMRANRSDYQKTLGEHFLYTTRTTSETFCKKICEEAWSLDLALDENDKSSIAIQIKDQPWFTGAIDSDPTVKSMLVVIDCIHTLFSNFEKSDSNKIDYSKAAEILVSRDCPISFFCLDLNNALGIESGIRDLYIKMNARGVPLTDFELFKADLQKKDNKNAHFDLMAEYLANNDTAFDRVKTIGKFNNEYTNFFFNLIDEGEIKDPTVNSSKAQMFDISMMNFINEVFRMNYFCAISKQGVSQKTYRSDNDIFRKMSGREFTSFIETCGKSFNDKYWKDGQIPQGTQDVINNSIVDSFSSIISLLDQFAANGVDFDASGVNCRYSIGEMIKKLAIDPQNNRALPFRESLIRMALYEFVLRFGIPNTDEQKEAFSTWARFVWKIDKNSDFKNFDEIVETLIGYKAIISASVDCTLGAIEKAIANSKTPGTKVLGAPAELHFSEETTKANLIISDVRWRDAVKQAEDYYDDCGQIWFLLELSKVDGNYDYDRFIRAFDISKKIFDKSRCVTYVSSNIFERALLAVREYDTEDHLLSMGKYTTNTKRFVGKDFSNHVSHQYSESSEQKEKERYNITIALLQKMVDDNSITDISKWLEDFVNAGSSTVDWKNIFIKNSLLNKDIPGLSFKNGFEPAAWNENGYQYIAVYTNEMKRTYSGELYSFLLASKLVDRGVVLHYHTDSQEEYIINGFPSRYFTVNELDIGYMCNEYYSRSNGVISKLGSESDVISKFVGIMP